jgi:hypothetical protein
MSATMLSSLRTRAWRLQAPSLDVDVRPYRLLLAVPFVVAAIAQLGLYVYGLYAISNDESARALAAHTLTWSGAFEPSVWPPLPKIVTGLALLFHDDLFVTPRIVTALTGLATLGALIFAARRLFDNRLIALIAGMLGVFIPQRLILSVVPLSDIFAYFLVTLAAGFLASWLRGKGNRELALASFFLFLAAATRLEVWFINVALAFYLAYRTLVRRDLSWPVFIGNGALLALFPCAWLLQVYVQTGSLEILSLTSRQFLDFAGRNYPLAIKNNALFTFAMDIVLGPALALGALAMTYLAIRDRAVREWALVLFVPLIVLGIDMFVTFSVPLAAAFRTDGIWALLLLPFGAWVLVWAAEHLATTRLARHAAAALLTYVAVMPFVLAARDMAHSFHNVDPKISAEELALGADLKQRLSRDGRFVLLDAIGDVGYLNVLVLANAPERFILNVDADPLITALYSWTAQAYMQRQDTAIVNAYLVDKFHIAEGLDMARIHARNIGYILVRKGEYIRALGANPKLSRAGTYGSWVLFELRASS